VGLGVRPLAVPDEARYGAIGQEMLERGDFVALRLGGFHWLEKPPLAIWGIAASIRAFGDNAFAIRLPSAIAALLAALAAGFVAARATGRPNMVALVVAVQSTTVGPLIFGTAAITDGAFTGMLALTMAAWYGACTSVARARLAWLAGAGVAAGLAFLCKGFLALALPALAASMHLIWQRRFRDLLVMPWIPIAVAALVVTPWAMLIHRREPDFWRFFIEYVHLRRAMRPDGIHHPEPWWLYLAILPPLGLFWTLLWPKAAGSLRQPGPWQDGVRFTLAWLVGPLLLLSASSGKLPTYALPLFPPISVLIAIGLVRAHECGRISLGGAEKFARLLLLLVAGAAALLAITGTDWTPIPALWNTAAPARWLALAGALLVWAALDRFSWRTTDANHWLMRTARAPALALACMPFLFPDAIVRGVRNPWAVLGEAHAALVSADCVVSTSPLAHAVIWQTRRRDLLVTGWPGEFDGGMQPAEDMARLVPTERLADAIRLRLAAKPGATVALVTPTDDAAASAAIGLPAPATRLDRDGVSVLFWRAP